MGHTRHGPGEVLGDLEGEPLLNRELIGLLTHWPDPLDVWRGSDGAIVLALSMPAGCPDARKRIYLSEGACELPAKLGDLLAGGGAVVTAQTEEMAAGLRHRYGLDTHECDIVCAGERGAAIRSTCHEVSQLTPDEADAMGAAQPWQYVLGAHDPSERLIHCLVQDGSVVASAAVGMRTPAYAEVRAVGVTPQHCGKGYGSAVVASACRAIVQSGRHPVYVTADWNEASRRLAQAVGLRQVMTVLRLSA